MRLTKSEWWIFSTILVFAIVGLVCSFVLTIEKVHLLQNPDAILSCSLNAWVNCASVMKTWQASLFGFPNSLIGLMAYPVVITVAVVVLMGAKLSRIFWAVFQLGVSLGLIFAYWLFFHSVYVIQVLCPWCLLVTLSTTLTFAALTRYNILQQNLMLPVKVQRILQYFVQKDYDKLFDATWLLVMIVLVFQQFKLYFTT